MNIPKYDIKASDNRLRYEFISTGPKGSIQKVVEYTYLSELGFWNLGFGDYDSLSDQINDTVVTDNNDARKVLATVVETLFDFFKVYSDQTVIFTGSDKRRNRVYNRAVALYQHQYANNLIITGLGDDDNERSLETDGVYFAFFIRKNLSNT